MSTRKEKNVSNGWGASVVSGNALQVVLHETRCHKLVFKRGTKSRKIVNGKIFLPHPIILALRNYILVLFIFYMYLRAWSTP